MDDFKKQQMKHVGPGGLKCPCCNDLHGKNRKRLNRHARARLKQQDRVVL